MRLNYTIAVLISMIGVMLLPHLNKPIHCHVADGVSVSVSLGLLCTFRRASCAPGFHKEKKKKKRENSQTNLFITPSFHICEPMHILSRLSRECWRLIPCCSYYWPLLRHYDVNDCLSAIRSINWIQRNVIHYSPPTRQMLRFL